MYTATFLPPSSSGIFSPHFQMHAYSSRSDGCWQQWKYVQAFQCSRNSYYYYEVLVASCLESSACAEATPSVARNWSLSAALWHSCNTCSWAVMPQGAVCTRRCDFVTSRTANVTTPWLFITSLSQQHVHFISTDDFFFFIWNSFCMWKISSHSL